MPGAVPSPLELLSRTDPSRTPLATTGAHPPQETRGPQNTPRPNPVQGSAPEPERMAQVFTV